MSALADTIIAMPVPNRIAAVIYVLSLLGCLFVSVREWRKFAKTGYESDALGYPVYLVAGLSGFPGINTALLIGHLVWIVSGSRSKTSAPTGDNKE